ncbi:syntaxin-17 [Nilaparvata lugens]|uniref:syntaxin-17 n=1 Tax=Nilaparvata lugens TaxID=108931 RepID=UPI00193E3063|nr:syntaxin-17 [Nilaparvata lugens]XP_039287693.1 syntaxin-17 [Nilaparvata lugens]
MNRARSNSQSSIQSITDLKQPLKWMELPISKFNEIAVPHHITQLKNIKLNIQKMARSGDWENMRKEQLKASKVIQQLRALVREMDILRNKVLDSDLSKFDKSIHSSRQAALSTLQEYKEMLERLPSSLEEDRDSRYTDEGESEQMSAQVQASVELSQLSEDVRRMERKAIAVEELQQEVEQVHELYQELAVMVGSQAEAVTKIESNVEETAVKVEEGERILRHAAKLKIPSYGLAGALLGTCLAGPVGFVAGFKLGSVAAVTGSFLGFTGGRYLKSVHESHIETQQAPALTASE